nr:uncharacterized protein LOC103410728 [Malus domestica]
MRELGEQVLEREFCQSTAKSFNRSAARAGKPIVKWTEKKRSQTYQSWNLRQGHQKMGHGMMLKSSLLTDSLERAKLFVGFRAEEDEWVNVKKAVRERSVPLEHSECRTLKVGDHVLCILERRDEAIYYDSHIYRYPKENARYKGPPVSSQSGIIPTTARNESV